MKSFSKKYKQHSTKKSEFIDGKYIFSSNSNHEINFPNNSVIEEQKREIQRQNIVINQLKEQLEELKEELELLKAMNQEC
jgi:hypothetical protein